MSFCTFLSGYQVGLGFLGVGQQEGGRRHVAGQQAGQLAVQAGLHQVAAVNEGENVLAVHVDKSLGVLAVDQDAHVLRVLRHDYYGLPRAVNPEKVGLQGIMA